MGRCATDAWRRETEVVSEKGGGTGRKHFRRRTFENVTGQSPFSLHRFDVRRTFLRPIALKVIRHAPSRLDRHGARRRKNRFGGGGGGNRSSASSGLERSGHCTERAESVDLSTSGEVTSRRQLPSRATGGRRPPPIAAVCLPPT